MKKVSVACAWFASKAAAPCVTSFPYTITSAASKLMLIKSLRTGATGSF